MSIFRVEKNANYTVISNYHLRDKNLSLKTIGLLSVILSLPDNWDYSQAGLAAICKDGEDSIRSCLKELEKYGYLERSRERDLNGRMRGMIYKIYEIPKNKDIKTLNKTYPETSKTNRNRRTKKCSTTLESPTLENPTLDNPSLGNPITENAKMENPVLDKKRQLIKDIKNTDKPITDKTIQPSISEHKVPDGQMDSYIACREYLGEKAGIKYFELKTKSLEEQFNKNEISLGDYDLMLNTYDMTTFNQVLGYAVDILVSLNKDPIKIGDELIDREVVKSKLMHISIPKMKKVIFALNTTEIKNPKKYAISMLYNL